MEIKLSKGERTRQKLIQNAIVYFNKFGLHQVKVDDLMQSLGLTSGVFYANFQSKDELLLIALEQQITHLKKALFFSDQDETSEAWLRAFVEFYLSPSHRDYMGLICPIPCLFINAQTESPRTQALISRYRYQLEGLLSKRINDCDSLQKWSANGFLALCIGSLQLARAESDIHRSNDLLEQTKLTILSQLKIFS